MIKSAEFSNPSHDQIMNDIIISLTQTVSSKMTLFSVLLTHLDGCYIMPQKNGQSVREFDIGYVIGLCKNEISLRYITQRSKVL